MAGAGTLRFSVRVRPGTSRTRVGGSYGPAPDLIVAVNAPAVGGAATSAVLAAVAEAFGVKRGCVRLVSGHTSRTKVLEVEGDATVLAGRLAALRDGAAN